MTPGTKLGPYEILAPIGAGGMGEVYRARDTRLDRIVALKVSKGPFTERFEREARVVASLNHPNIASLFDVGPNYLVMEYVEGEPLSGPLPIDRVLQYAAQICDALDAAHRKGITHRDLKPANILVNKQGIKLLDFGLAKIREEPQVSAETISAALTAQGAVLGTPQYMAPEQVEGREADARSDIFALGCVLYEMLTGRKAFAGKNASTIAAAILAKDPEPIENLPPALERVILTCLSKDADERFQNARDVKLALRWAMQPGSTPVTGRKKWLPWVVAAAFGVSTLVLLYLRQSPPSAERAVHLQIQPPEKTRFLAFFEHGAAASPDGRSLVLVTRSQDGKTSLWIRSLDSATPRPLPGTDGANAPFWSPDSRFVAFSADKKLKRIEVAGGTPQIVCDLSLDNGTWNESGDILVDSGHGIKKVAASGGAPVDLIKPDPAAGEESIGNPAFLPDGRHFLFTALTNSDQRIYAASLDHNSAGKGGRKLILTDAGSAQFMPAVDRKQSGVPGYLFYTMGWRTLMARPFDPDKLEFGGDAMQIAGSADSSYSVSSSGTLVWRSGSSQRQVTWLDNQGKPSGTVGLPGIILGVSMSPDGRRATVSRKESDRHNVWILDLERGVSSRLTSGDIDKYFPIWSRRGDRIFFTAKNGSVGDIYSIGPDGGAEELVFRDPNHDVSIAEDTSPDGRFLLYSANDPKTGLDIWALPLEGDKKPFPVVQTAFRDVSASFSPDGRWVAYVSNESGADQVYVKSFPPTERRWQISSDGGNGPRWRGDGKQLYYLGSGVDRLGSGRQLMVVDLRLGSSVEASPPREQFVLERGVMDIRYDPSPNGQRFLTLLTDIEPSAVPWNVVVNWPATVLRNKP